MKYSLIFSVLLLAFNSFGQTAGEYLKSGIDKHNAKDYKAAIKEYTKAIEADKSLTEAYYNRSICNLALQDLKAAKKDLDKTIELNPQLARAYYSRATIFVNQEQYPEAIGDLNNAIAIEPAIPNALSLRGQLRAQIGNLEGACGDFNQAKTNGDPKAEKYITQYCNTQQIKESLMLDWPDGEKWKVGSEQETDKQHTVELVRGNETVEQWTEMGSMVAIKGVTGIAVDKAMNLMFDQAKKNAPKAKLTFIEKDETAEHPWILFTIESPGFNNDNTPESQLWYIVQGKQSLYSNFRAVKQATIPADLKEKWAKFFKTGKVVTR